MRTSFFVILFAASALVNAAPAPGRFSNLRPQVTKPKGGSGGSATSGNTGNVNGGSVINLGDYGVINKPYASKYPTLSFTRDKF